jgi:hypothetical protein
VTYTAQNGDTAYLIGAFPDAYGLQPIEPPRLSWAVAAGIVTVTATFSDAWSDALGPDLYMDHSSSGFRTFNVVDDTPLGNSPPLTITFPYPAAGQVEYVSAVRIFGPTSLNSGSSEYSYLTIVGDSATAVSVGATLGQIGIPVVLLDVPEDDQWLALSTIPDAVTEVGTEYRQQYYAAGAGSVRIGANIKTLTGTPTIGGNYTLDGFSTIPSLVSFTPGGTGVQYSGWTAMPPAAQADIGVTWSVGAGSDTAALDLYRVWLEYLPTTVSGVREHSDEHAPEYS